MVAAGLGLAVGLGLGGGVGQAQAQDAVGLDSPAAVVEAFAAAMERVAEDSADAEAWAAAQACFDLTAPVENPRRVARHLWQALSHLGPDRMADVPRGEAAADEIWFTYFPRRGDPRDGQLAQAAGFQGERIALQPVADGSWRFSRQTLGVAQTLAAKLAPFADTDGDAAWDASRTWFEKVVPEALRTSEVMGVRYWQWVVLVLLLVLAVAVDTLSKVIAAGMMGRLLNETKNEHREVIRGATRPLGLLIAGWLVLMGLRVLNLEGTAGQVLLAAVRVFMVLVGVWTGWRLLDVLGAYVLSKTRRTETKFDDVLVPLFRKGLKLAVLAVGLVYGAKALNIDVLPLLTGLGIGSLAFAFAAKDTIENFFGSIAVILDRPFEVGDWVAIGDVEGTVEELGFRSTRVRTFYNSQVTVPNSTLVRATVDNYGRRQYRRWKTHLGLQYGTTPDQLIAFTEGVRELVRTHPYTRKDYYQVWLHQWSASSMDVLLYVFFEVPDWNTELRERERLFVDIVRLADHLGVEFAFPTQTVHLHRADESAAQEPAAAPTSMTDRRSLVSGIRAAQRVIADQPWRTEKPGPQTYGQVGPTPIDEAGNAVLEPDEPQEPQEPQTPQTPQTP